MVVGRTSPLRTWLDLQAEADKIRDFSEVMGRFIDKEIITARNVATGGTTVEILGPQGTGKTSLMLNYACRIMEENPDELIIWKDSWDSQSQFNRIKDWEVFAEEGVELRFRNIRKNEEENIEVKHFSDFEHLARMLSPQQLNVVYLKDDIIGWAKLLNFFRRYKGWQSIFIDEYKDIAPINTRSPYYNYIGEIAKEMSMVRKGLVSFYGNTQSKSQIDYRFRSGFMVVTYLSGAKKDKITSIYQQAINKLDKGEAWLSWYGKFGKIHFPAFPPKEPIMDVEDLNRLSGIDKLIMEENQKWKRHKYRSSTNRKKVTRK